ncbi:MAG: hypothetical protein M3Y27_02200, partial [Acidobacteriota bacterium]|nr:hypothetical protein [Acidobacteriota bacterium]
STALPDGGLPKWTNESRSRAKDSAEVKQGKFTPRPRPEVVVDINAVKDLSFAANQRTGRPPVLVDARTTGEFNGTTACHVFSRILALMVTIYTNTAASRQLRIFIAFIGAHGRVKIIWDLWRFASLISASGSCWALLMQ